MATQEKKEKKRCLGPLSYFNLELKLQVKVTLKTTTYIQR